MKSHLKFINFVVPKFLFEKVEISKDEEFFKLQPKAVIDRKEKQFHINIDLEINDSKNSFITRILGVGIFQYETDDEKLLLNYIAINGPAIIFPYIRSFLSSFTSLSGFDTITLPTLNLSGFKDEIIENLIDIDELKENE